jgi:hypothetical protein
MNLPLVLVSAVAVSPDDIRIILDNCLPEIHA